MLKDKQASDSKNIVYVVHASHFAFFFSHQHTKANELCGRRRHRRHRHSVGCRCHSQSVFNELNTQTLRRVFEIAIHRHPVCLSILTKTTATDKIVNQTLDAVKRTHRKRDLGDWFWTQMKTKHDDDDAEQNTFFTHILFLGVRIQAK